MNIAFIVLGEYFKSTETEAYFKSCVDDLNNRVFFQKHVNLNRDKLSKEFARCEIECLVIETFDSELNGRKQRRIAIANILTILTHRPKRIIFMPKQVKEFIEIVKEWGPDYEIFTYNTAIEKQPRKLHI